MLFEKSTRVLHTICKKSWTWRRRWGEKAFCSMNGFWWFSFILRGVFLNKYYIDEGLLVDELKAKLTEKYGDSVDWNEIKKLKLPELRFHYYKLWENDKIRLTEKEGRDIMGMYREVKRQPIADYGNDWYEKTKGYHCKLQKLETERNTGQIW